MALFGGKRDVSLIKSISKELINDIVQTEIAYYKFALEQTSVNVYGEAPGKNYYEPLKIASLINRQDQAWSSDDFGPDVNQIIDFRFFMFFWYLFSNPPNPPLELTWRQLGTKMTPNRVQSHPQNRFFSISETLILTDTEMVLPVFCTCKGT